MRPDGSGEYEIDYRTIGIEDGVERWIAAKGGTIFTEGKAVRFVGTAIDISERKRRWRGQRRNCVASGRHLTISIEISRGVSHNALRSCRKKWPRAAVLKKRFDKRKRWRRSVN